jgi:hypothetical protein
MNQKTNIHVMGSYRPYLGYYLANTGRETETPLTQAEARLSKILQKTGTSTVIGKAISIVVSGTPGTFRKLVGELRDQLRDAPVLLEKVIGRNAVELLNDLL